MLRTTVLLFGVCCALVCSVAASARDTLPSISIAAQEMPDLLKEGADLPYNQVMALLLERAPANLNITIYPGQRGVMQWARRESQCLFGNITLPGQQRIPHSVLSADEFGELVFAGPFNRISVHMFALHTAPPTDARAIGTQLVGIDLITFTDINLYAPSLRRLKYAKVASTLEAFRLLEQGRVPMVLAYNVDAALALEKLDIGTDLRVDTRSPILEFEENLACWRSPETVLLTGHVQKQVNRYRADGTLARLLPTVLAPPAVR